MLGKFVVLTSMTLLLASVSHAHQVVCDGNYAIYHFRFQASLNSTDTRIRGPISVIVTGAGQTRTGTLNATSSDIRAGYYIRASGSSPEATGTLNANYEEASGLYKGVLNAVTSDRTVNVNVRCGIYLD